MRGDQLESGPAAAQLNQPSIKDGKRLASSRRWNLNKPLIIMFIPVAAYFIIFKYIPMMGIVIAFKDYNMADGIWGSPWVGLENYKYLFSNPQMMNVIRNTFILSLLNVFVGFPFPIVLAILLNEVRKAWFKKWVQTLVYLPHFLNWVIVGGLIVMVFAQETGIVNQLVKAVTGDVYPFLYKHFTWLSIYAGSTIWKGAGWSAIIYLAALTAIDTSLYEAASIDGANKWRKIWHVTLPGIQTTVVLMFILNIGHVMEVGFDQVFVLQNALVSDISEVISTWNFKYGLGTGEFSYGTALGLFESLIGLVLVLTANAIARKFDQGMW
ncbi:ABC transporter permease subunit [Paenibacillus sp. J5C_2022]|uniref:ABC transporter permease n=1 Tax=Paenibacillus sp. J5C2022 TaxID=2977129 RepID=UPI0021D381E4|nr:ABC transporter permease subunit [Paenibacillus sp. J5C2022]MCU6711418.1 ABC transporter permease subunit [Paenibacillus sp. J5C2022]